MFSIEETKRRRKNFGRPSVGDTYTEDSEAGPDDGH